jgi:hypothetical protein
MCRKDHLKNHGVQDICKKNNSRDLSFGGVVLKDETYE